MECSDSKEHTSKLGNAWWEGLEVQELGEEKGRAEGGQQCGSTEMYSCKRAI